MNSKTVTIIGSYNVDFISRGEVLPSVGETVIGNQFYEGCGGKGSNQAVAASCLGAQTRFIGRVGFDKYGQDAIAMYKRMGIDFSTIKVDTNNHTGISVILIDAAGHNLISVIPGANFHLSMEDIEAAVKVLANSFIVGFQLENKLEVIDSAIRMVHKMGIPVFLDPAPAANLPLDLYSYIDIIKPNEIEATILTGINVSNEESAEEAGHWFLSHGVKTAIITMGEQGSTLVDRNGSQHFYPPKVTAVDTTGAGDTFAGAFLMAAADGKSMEYSINFANHAAAISTTRIGVINAIPEQNEVLASMEASKISNP